MAAVQSRASEKKINLDMGPQRRHSFLPENWATDEKQTFKDAGGLEYEDDDLFMLLQSSQDNTDKPMEKFCTGSKYLGHWNKLGIAGKGVYKYPHGVIYDGYFNKAGEFHGTGILIYPNGQRIEGMWKNGKLGDDCNLITQGGVIMTQKYCQMPDRRYHVEVENDFNPVGQEYLTDEIPPPRYLPDECYDLVEGFYDPKIKAIVDYVSFGNVDKSSVTNVTTKRSLKYVFSGDEDRHTALSKVSAKTESEKDLETLMRVSRYDTNKTVSWIPSKVQEEWIVTNCRKADDDPVGYRPDLYEEWTKGGLTATTSMEDGGDQSPLAELNLLDAVDIQKDFNSTRFKQNPQIIKFRKQN